MDKIRLIHFADLHIGVERYGKLDTATGVNRRVLDFLHRLDDLVDYGLQHDVDLVIFAGDAYKRTAPSPTYQRAFARRMKRLTDAGVAVLLLVGNRDQPARIERASSIEIFRTLDVPGVIVASEERLHRIGTRRGTIQVAAVPYPVRQRLLASSDQRGLTTDELHRLLREAVTTSIATLAAQVDSSLPSVLVAHISMSGALPGSERSNRMGSDVVIHQADLALSAWDYVALGHMHRHQVLSRADEPPIVYSGSLERMSFEEERQPKGFCWVEVSPGDVVWEFIEVDARPFVTVQADLRNALNPLAALQDEVKQYAVDGALVRVLLRLRPEQERFLSDRDVREHLVNAEFITGVSRQIERESHVRLGRSSPEKLTDHDLLARYLDAQGVEPERVDALLEYADLIFEEAGE